MIGLTVGVVPTGFVACDGTQGTPNLNGNSYFIKGANTTGEIGTTGGAASHTHTVTHGHTVPSHTHTGSGTSSGPSGSNQGAYGSEVGNVTTGTHTHAGGGASSLSGSTTVGNTALTLPANTSNDPPYSTVIYVMSVASTAKAFKRTLLGVGV